VGQFPAREFLQVSAVVADTHTVLWYLSADPRLSLNARKAMDEPTDEGEPIFVPTICIVEATYLVEKGRIDSGALTRLEQALRWPDSSFQPAPLTADIAFALAEIPRNAVPDLPGRVV
jgi:PIN domain nuclease of toxin-antitoxin system